MAGCSFMRFLIPCPISFGTVRESIGVSRRVLQIEGNSPLQSQAIPLRDITVELGRVSRSRSRNGHPRRESIWRFGWSHQPGRYLNDIFKLFVFSIHLYPILMTIYIKYVILGSHSLVESDDTNQFDWTQCEKQGKQSGYDQTKGSKSKQCCPERKYPFANLFCCWFIW